MYKTQQLKLILLEAKKKYVYTLISEKKESKVWNLRNLYCAFVTREGQRGKK